MTIPSINPQDKGTHLEIDRPKNHHEGEPSMTTNDHPLTRDRAIDPHQDPRPWQDCTRKDICAGDLVESQINTRLSIGTAHHQDVNGDWLTEGGDLLTDDDRWPLRRIPAPTPEKETAMTETTPAEPLAREYTDPHHDLRPWQDCTVEDICAGDLVERRRGTGLSIGVAHHKDEDGDWLMEDGWLLTCGDDWTLRHIPAPTSEKDTTLTENTPAEPLAREYTDPFQDPRPWEACTFKDIRKGDLVESRTADRLHIGVAHHQDLCGNWLTAYDLRLTDVDHWPLRRIPAPTPEKETSMTETTPAASSEPLARTLLGVPDTHGAPHHGAIKAGDYVMQMDKTGSIRGGVARYQDACGNWIAGNGKIVAWASIRADRPDALTVWPAPTPPAEEITLPTDHPAHITDVENADGDVCAYMALDRNGGWLGVDQNGVLRVFRLYNLTAFTLPDGTRARRDGYRKDGIPRFIKVQEEEK